MRVVAEDFVLAIGWVSAFLICSGCRTQDPAESPRTDDTAATIEPREANSVPLLTEVGGQHYQLPWLTVSTVDQHAAEINRRGITRIQLGIADSGTQADVLRRLCISCTQLTALSICNSDLSVDDLQASISSLPHLVALSLSGCRLTRDQPHKIGETEWKTHMPELTSLSIKGCRGVDNNTVARLLAICPELEDSDDNDSTVPLESEVFKCTISPDGNLVAMQNNRDIDIWDVKKGVVRAKLKHEHKPFSFTFRHDSRRIATGTSNDNMVRVFDTSRGALRCELKAHTKGTIFLSSAVYSLAFSPNGKFLASGVHDGRVVVWDLTNSKPLLQTQIEGPPIVCSLAFSPDSSLLAGSFENAGAKRGIRVWSVSGDTE